MAAEKNFENKIKTFLKDEGCWFVKYWSGRSATGKTFTKEGIPDILVCCKGFFIGVEVKAKTGKPKMLQLYNLKKIDESGGYALLLYPDMWDDFKKFIQNPLHHAEWYRKNIQFQEDWKKKLSKESG